MFARNPKNEKVPMKSHFTKGEAEISTKDYAQYTGLQAWSDVGFARDTVATRRSTSSSVYIWGEVAFASQCVR